MFGEEKLQKWMADTAFKRMKFFSPKHKKYVEWWFYSFPQILNAIIWFLGLLWIWGKVYDKYGIDKIIIVSSIIIILTLRGIAKTLSKT